MKIKKFDKSTLEVCEVWANRYKSHDYSNEGLDNIL